jgi:molybdenum cofactor cytidylyltransferase
MPAIILAAGASLRLGHPKQLVLVDGETLLAMTMRMARESGADPVIVVLGGNQASIEAVVDFQDTYRVFNADWEQGIAASICAGIEAVGTVCPEASAALLLACDQPYLTADYLRTLLETSKRTGSSAIVASRYKGVPGIPAIFPKAYFVNLRGLEGDVGARQILRSHEHDLACVDFVGGEFDIDSPADLAVLRQGLAVSFER